MNYLSPNYKDSIKLGVAMLVVFVLVVLIAAVDFGPSQEEVKRISKQCVEFYKLKRASENAHVEAIDSWTKNGRLVIELAEKKAPSDSSYMSGICLYDEKNGRIELPGLFNQDKWDK